MPQSRTAAMSSTARKNELDGVSTHVCAVHGVQCTPNVTVMVKRSTQDVSMRVSRPHISLHLSCSHPGTETKHEERRFAHVYADRSAVDGGTLFWG
eukprot:scaffold131443_cov18-Tisochrysis_lutea.AAC.4